MAPTWDVPVLLELGNEYAEKQSKRLLQNSGNYFFLQKAGNF